MPVFWNLCPNAVARYHGSHKKTVSTSIEQYSARNGGCDDIYASCWRFGMLINVDLRSLDWFLDLYRFLWLRALTELFNESGAV